MGGTWYPGTRYPTRYDDLACLHHQISSSIGISHHSEVFKNVRFVLYCAYIVVKVPDSVTYYCASSGAVVYQRGTNCVPVPGTRYLIKPGSSGCARFMRTCSVSTHSQFIPCLPEGLDWLSIPNTLK